MMTMSWMFGSIGISEKLTAVEPEFGFTVRVCDPPPLPGCAASSAPQPSAHAVTSSTNVMSLRSCGARARAAGGTAAVDGQQEVKRIGRSEIRNHETKPPAALGEKGLF